MLNLYDYFRSSAAFRVRIALNLKGLSYERLPVHLVNNGGEQHSLQYKQINPQQLVPTLVDGNHVITQSLAIIEYINDIHPEPSLLPSDPYQKALVKAFALSITSDLHPLNNLRVLNYLKDELHITEEQKNAWYQHWLTLCFTALEAQLSTQPTRGKFCFGNQPSLADICLVPQMFNARRFNTDLSPYPILFDIDAHCQTLDAVKNAWPKEAVT
jgi:maleylpyruvate isomerase